MNFITNVLQKVANTVGLGGHFEAHKHHVPRMGRVMIVGGIGAILQTIIFEILGIWLRLVAPSTATLIGALAATLSNFLLNERFNFHDVVDHAKPKYRRMLKFYFVGLGSLATQWTCVFIAEQFTHDALLLNLAFIVGVGIGFFFNYTGYYFFVWRRKN